MHRFPANTPWSDRFGYSRAVRRGGVIEVSGTSGPGADAYSQAREAYRAIIEAVMALGGGPADVVRVRVFTTNVDYAEDIGRAHREVFADILPTMSLYGINALIAPEMLVEIEATAILDA